MKNVLITAGASGIGKRIAEKFFDKGYNIWVCDISGGILGYAQFPGGPSSSDGVVCDYAYFGNTGTAIYPYDLGRTATHEVGHWLNLRHIWGDANCGNDYCNDTPEHSGSNYSCPSYPSTSNCNGNGQYGDCLLYTSPSPRDRG